MPQFNRLQRAGTGTGFPPELYTSGGVHLGECVSWRRTATVTLPECVRDRHVYLVGKTRSGKSTLLMNIARQDILRGAGVAVIDPHGDLAEDLLQHIPEERAQDTIYFDASDKQHPIALNVLNAQSEEEIGLLADDLMVTFRRLSDSWGERMETILRYTFHTLLRAPGSTFIDIQHILQNGQFRERIVRQADFPTLTDFWYDQFPQLPKDATQPVLNRMSKFVLSPTLHAMLSQARGRLDFSDVIQNGKVLLVNLASGRIGEDNAKLLGSLIVSQLQLAVMRRAGLPRSQRRPFYLFVDEFQHFTTSAFEKILSEAGKYKLSLTLAHQYISQLSESLRYAILGNVGTLVMFPLGQHDANALRSELGQFEPNDLANLSAQAHEALCRPATQSRDTFKFTTLAPPPAPEESFAAFVIERTRKQYASAPPARSSQLPQKEAPIPHTLQPAPASPAAPMPPQRDALKLDAPKASTATAVPRQPKPKVGTATVPRKATMAEATLPAQAGRGGAQHKYLQQLIKRLAEDKGFRVIVEQPVLGGTGFVDVSLEQGERKIACEISVTSTEGYEIGNIQKCLAAGYDQVIVLSAEKRALQKLERAASSHLESETAGRVLFLQPEGFVSFIEEAAGEASGKEERVRGYKVKVQYKAVDSAERQARQQAIAQVILGALKRMKDNNGK